MFLGQYEHTIDEKGRMTIPARYREQVEGGAFITRGLSQNLLVFTATHFARIYDHVNQMSITDPVASDLRRLIFSNAVQVEFDKAGRILIPQFLREAAQLGTQVAVAGVGEHFEIWSKENWAKQNELLQDANANAQRFAALNV